MRLKGHFKDIFYLLVILLVGLYGLKALFHPGFYTSLDGWHNIARIYHYSEAVQDGQFPPKWIGTLASGYGYPLFVFSYHAPWLMALPLLKLGFDYFVALKLILILGFVGSGFFMYGWLREFLSKEAALTGAIIYLWTPYRFSKILVGASVGEATVFLFLPLFFWGLWGVANKKATKYILLGSMGLFGIINSHFILLPLLAPFACLYLLVLFLASTNKKSFLFNEALLLILGLGLSSFYLIPLFAYHASIAAASMAGGFSDLYRNNLVNLNQLLYSKWGYGPITTSAKDGEQPLQIGFAQWAGVGALCMAICYSALRKRMLLLPIVLLGVFCLCVFLMIDTSRPIWDMIEKIVQIDYPWRNLAITTFIGSISVGVVVNSFKRASVVLVFGFAFLAFINNRNHLLVNQYTDIPLSLYIDSETTTNTYAEYLPTWVKTSIKTKPTTWIDNADVTITDIQKTSKTLEFTATLLRPEILRINYLYFPGQVAFINGHQRDITYSTDGRIFLSAPKGESRIKISFDGNSLMDVGNSLTLTSMVIFGALMMISFFPKPKPQKHQSSTSR